MAIYCSSTAALRLQRELLRGVSRRDAYELRQRQQQQW
jgi:heme exporter protein D